jgi:hypothetical protein
MKAIKKPIPVDVHQFISTDPMWPAGVYAGAAGWFIDTLEGKMEVKDRSYIVTGPGGEKWAIREEEFNATYQILDDTPEHSCVFDHESIPGGGSYLKCGICGALGGLV